MNLKVILFIYLFNLTIFIFFFIFFTSLFSLSLLA